MMADIPDTNNVSGYGNHSSSFNRFRHHHQHNQGNLLILEPNTPIDGALNELMKYCDSNSVDFDVNDRPSNHDKIPTTTPSIQSPNGAVLLSLDDTPPTNDSPTDSHSEDYPFGDIFADDDDDNTTQYSVNDEPNCQLHFHHGLTMNDAKKQELMLKLEEQRRRNRHIAQLLSPIRKNNEKLLKTSNTSSSNCNKLLKIMRTKRKFSLLMSSSNIPKKTLIKPKKVNNSIIRWRTDVVPLIQNKITNNIEDVVRK